MDSFFVAYHGGFLQKQTIQVHLSRGIKRLCPLNTLEGHNGPHQHVVENDMLQYSQCGQ